MVSIYKHTLEVICQLSLLGSKHLQLSLIMSNTANTQIFAYLIMPFEFAFAFKLDSFSQHKDDQKYYSVFMSVHCKKK